MPELGTGYAALACAALLLVGTAIRIGLAVVVLRRPEASVQPEDLTSERVTVLQAVLSGDPTMLGNLLENLANHREARFVWLVDEVDAEGRRITADLAAAAPGQVEVVLTPQRPPGHNPKVFKLAIGLRRCGELVAVLDDDTVLPPGALDRARRALSRGDLVTGIPVYRHGRGWSRLVAAFVNANALVTYLPMLTFGAPVTINGMFYLTRRSCLEALGGFGAIQDRVCDDYAIATLYRGGGRRIVQTTIAHPIATTMTGPRGYLRLLRRWLVFAGYPLREVMNPAVVALILVPSLLPLASAVLAALSANLGVVALVLGVLVTKATAIAVLRRRALDTPEGVGTVALEVLADLLLPLHAVTALVRPGQLRWRDKVLSTVDGSLTGVWG